MKEKIITNYFFIKMKKFLKTSYIILFFYLFTKHKRIVRKLFKYIFLIKKLQIF